MTPAEFKAFVVTLVDGDASTSKSTRAALVAELLSRGLTPDEADVIVAESLAAELAKREAARLAARATKLAAIRTALGLP